MSHQQKGHLLSAEGALPASDATPSPSAPRQPLLRESSLVPRYLELIRSGAKTVEGRIHAGKWTDVISGDTFRFFSTEDPTVAVLCRVTTVNRYDCFQAMLQGEGLQACLPGIAELEEGVEVYRSIPGYREREAADGVVAVGVQVVASE